VVSWLAAAVPAVLLGAGGAMIAWTLTDPNRSPRRRALPRHWTARGVAIRAALAVCAGGVVWAVTGWPAAAAWCALLGTTAPSLLGVGRRRAAEQARIEAVAVWAEMLRDQVAAGADLAQAVQATAARTPSAIAGPVRRLAGRLRSEPPSAPLVEFSDALAEPTADLVAAALAVAFTQPARRLAELLSTAAGAARAQVSLRSKIESERSRTRTVAELAGGVVIGWVALVYAVSGQFLSAYDSAAGQLVLLIAGALFALGVAALARLDKVPQPPRLHLPQTQASGVRS
jgi:hypothetical protein